MTDSSDTDPTIEELRDRLDELDGQILQRIAERQAIVAEIGTKKHIVSRPLRDFAREREVLEQGAAKAARLGLTAELAQDVLSRLIHHSLVSQEQHQIRRTAKGEGQTALVIGGLGRMGQWLARFLDAQGFQVTVADPAVKNSEEIPFETWPDYQQLSLDHDLIAVAAPLRPSNAILMDLAKRQPTGLVFDVGSLKQPLQSGLQALHAAGCRVTSLHPMFGPDTVMLSGRQVLLMDVGHAEATAEAHSLFQSTMAEVVRLSLDEHDRVMAWVLGLSHLLNVAFASTLAEDASDKELLAQVSSTTFGRQLGLARSVVAENPSLYFEIQHLNQYGRQPLQQFARQFENLLEQVKAGDEASFTRQMESARQGLNSKVTR